MGLMMPMFDIEDSKDVDLSHNRTESPEFLKGKGISRLRAHANEAGSQEGADKATEKREWRWFRDNIGMTVASSLIVVAVLAALISFCPACKEYLK
jgi:hypothetical protein